MVRQTISLIVISSALAACGGTNVEHRPDRPPHARTDRATETDDRIPVAAFAVAPLSFLATPITPFAQAMTRSALSAVEGGPITPLPVATRRPLGTSAVEVDWSPHIDGRPTSVEVLSFAFELELVLKRGEPPDDLEGPSCWGSVRATVALARHGLRLVDIRPRVMEPDPEGGVAPAGFTGLAELARTLLADLAAGDMERYELSETDRRELANDAVWRRVNHDRFTPTRVAQLQEMVSGLPAEPLSIRLDDVAILIRDERQRLFSLSMDFDVADGSYVLSTSPLVRVGQLWPLDPSTTCCSAL